MGGRNYTRLGIESFGASLLASNDLDPVYVALTTMKWRTRAQLHRWLLAYWCFYHAGVASYMSEQEEGGFSRALWVAVRNLDAEPAPHGGRWERGKERRHFRGKQAGRTISHLFQRYNGKPEKMVSQLRTYAPSYEKIATHIRSHVGFGPWITFKVADMCDRVLDWQVDFDQAVVFMFKDPREAALMYWRQENGDDPLDNNILPPPYRTPVTILMMVEKLIIMFKDHKAPPFYDRPVNLQEIETILCKWKSHMKGHYPLNNDLDEINEGLVPWLAHSPTARKFRKAMPRSES